MCDAFLFGTDIKYSTKLLDVHKNLFISVTMVGVLDRFFVAL